MDTRDELRTAWLNFIEKFTGEEFDKSKENIKTGDFRFEIKNFLQTGIKINDSYGFLTVDFRDRSCKWNVQDFLSFTKIEFKSTQMNKMTFWSTDWPIEDFPCRIYGANDNGRLRFYPSSEITDMNKHLNSYIKVFQNVVFTIIKLKIKSSSEK